MGHQGPKAALVHELAQGGDVGGVQGLGITASGVPSEERKGVGADFQGGPAHGEVAAARGEVAAEEEGPLAHLGTPPQKVARGVQDVVCHLGKRPGLALRDARG